MKVELRINGDITLKSTIGSVRYDAESPLLIGGDSRWIVEGDPSEVMEKLIGMLEPHYFNALNRLSDRLREEAKDCVKCAREEQQYANTRKSFSEEIEKFLGTWNVKIKEDDDAEAEL